MISVLATHNDTIQLGLVKSKRQTSLQRTKFVFFQQIFGSTSIPEVIVSVNDLSRVSVTQKVPEPESDENTIQRAKVSVVISAPFEKIDLPIFLMVL